MINLIFTLLLTLIGATHRQYALTFTCNTYSLISSIPLVIGTPPIKASFCLDLQENTTWVHSKSCSSCNSRIEYTCVSSQNCEIALNYAIYFYGKALNGYMVTDRIDFGSFSTYMPLLEVHNENHNMNTLELNYKIDGCIGVGLNGYNSNNSYLSKLITQGIIGYSLIEYERIKQNTYITLGGYNHSAINDTSKLIWFKSLESWGIKIDSIDINNYHAANQEVFFQAGIDQIFVPKTEYNKIIDTIKRKECSIRLCIDELTEYSKMPNIELRVNNGIVWSISYKHYTRELTRIKKQNSCSSGDCGFVTYVSYEIVLIASTKWILGLDVFENIAVVLDYENALIGLQPQANELEQSTATEQDYIMGNTIIIPVIMAVVLIGALVTYLVAKLRKPSSY